MPEVAPVGDQESQGAVTPAGIGPAPHVLDRVVDTRKEAVPARGARAHEEVATVLGEARHPVVIAGGLVPPVEEDDVVVELGDALGVGVRHVRPDHGSLAMGPGQLANAAHVGEKRPSLAQLLLHPGRPAGAQVEGLVAVRVEPA